MGRYYRDTAQLYEIYGAFLRRVLEDPKVGPKMARTGIIIRFEYTDPDAVVTIDLKNPPAEPGMHGTFHMGPCSLRADTWSRQSADHSHRFWHGLENPIASVAKGQVKQGGNVVAMLKLLPVVRHAFRLFPVVLAEMGHEDLIVERR